MGKKKKSAPAPLADSGMDSLAKPAEAADEGVSLDALSAAFAEMLGQGNDPYSEPPAAAPPADDPVAALAEALPRDDDAEQDAACEISPTTILEAMLFVGDPENAPISPQWIAGLMRGVRPAEIDAAVRELNDRYREENCPYEIVSEGDGYRLALRPAFHALRDKFFGRYKAVRLSQAAVEVLSVVAYRGGLTADEVAKLRGSPSKAVLAQLVRRQLLRIELPEGAARKQAKFHPTQRFLDLFGLESIDDLPRSQEIRPA